MLKQTSSHNCDLVDEELPSIPSGKGFSYRKQSLCGTSLQRRIDGKTHTTWQKYTVKNVSRYSIIDENLSSIYTIIECPSFSSGAGIDNDDWSWKIEFNHRPNFSWINIYANCSINEVPVRAITTAYIVDNKGNEIFGGRYSGYYSGLYERRIANFFDTNFNFNKEEFLPNDSLTVCLKLTILLDDETPFPAYMPIKLEPNANLPSHFKELYHSRKNTGGVVIKVKEQLFRVHKEVLKIRIPQALDRFAIQVVQGKKNFEILDIDCEVFEKLLEFLYLDQVTDIDDCIVPLWEASHKYKLTALKSICEKIISEDFLSVTNAHIITNLSKKFASRNFRVYMISFLDKNDKNREYL